MIRKAINITAWIAFFLLAAGLTFKVKLFPGAGALLVLGILTSQLIFIPLFFFSRNSQLDQHYSNPIIRKIQGLCFSIIGLYPLFLMQRWGGRDILHYSSLSALLILSITFFFTKKPKFRRPHIPAVLTVIIMTSIFVYLLQQLRNSGIYGDIKEVYVDVSSLNGLLVNALEEDSLVYSKLQSDPVLNQIHRMKLYTAMATDNKDSTYGITLLKSHEFPINWPSTYVSDYHFTGFGNSAIDSSLLASTLKLKLQDYVTGKAHLYPDSLTNIDQFSFGGKLVDGETISWETVNFENNSAAFNLTILSAYEHFILSEKLIESHENRFNYSQSIHAQRRLEVYQLFKHKIQHLEALQLAKYDQNSVFFRLMIVNFFIVFLMYFIPRFKMSDAWKTRLLLFFIVIIFEFVLLVTDFFVGIFSQNPMYLLMINSILAIGLVTLDNFVRSNFLNWYKE